MTNENYHLPSEVEINDSVEIFKAFGDQTRYKILSLLFHHTLSVNEIANALNLSQSATSHQLKVLRQVRLIKGMRHGQKIEYSLADEHVMMIFQQVKAHILED